MTVTTRGMCRQIW